MSMVKGLGLGVVAGILCISSAGAASPIAPLESTGTGSVTIMGLTSPTAIVTESATFFVTAPTAGSSSCTTQKSGSCTFVSCPAPTGAAPTPPAEASAGTITLSGAGFASDDTLSSGDGNAYSSHFHIGAGWSDKPGSSDSIKVSAAGGTGDGAVPAFSADVKAVHDIGLSNPTCASQSCTFAYDGGAAGALSTSRDLVATWANDDSPGDVLMVFSTSSTNGTKAVSCSFTPSAKSGTVPASLLAMLDPLGDGVTANTSIQITNTTAVTAGAYAVNVSLTEQLGSGAFTE
jgi:hypothetical protein